MKNLQLTERDEDKMTLEQLEKERDQHIERRRKALEKITELTLQDPTEAEDEILDLAYEAWEALQDARDAKARWKELRDQVRPKCECGCHSNTP